MLLMFSFLDSRKKPIRFPRNRHRENGEEDFFNTAYKSLSFMATIIIPAIFTPTIIISSLISQGILFSLGNIALALGYCIHFIHRFMSKELSYPELFASMFFLGTLLAVTFYTAPVTIGFTLIESINFLNLVSTSINSFFLIRDFIVPPFQALIKYTFTWLGYELHTSFFSKPPLTLKQDGPIIDRLIKKHYQHDSFSPDFSPKEINPFNRLLEKMVVYINKYQEPFFGTLLERKNINRLENAIDDLVIKGNTDSGLAFINQKIDFKTHKVKLIKQAIEQHQEPSVAQSQHSFFKRPKPATSLSELQEELQRQEEKIASLQLCLP